jgi:hypothetical protein
MIKGGYILQPRIIKSSEVAHMSPCTREVWYLLLREAMFENFGNLKRGQVFITINDIRDGLHWYVGYRKETYSRRSVEGSLKVLRDGGMIVTMKVTHGMIVTICKYDYYQDKKNYEGNSEGGTKVTAKVERMKKSEPDNNKNYKEEELEEELPEKIQAEKIDFIGQIISVFSDEYEAVNQIEYNQISKGKERAAAAKILQLHKAKHPEMDSSQTLDSLRIYFKLCVSISDEWLQSNMSLPTIVSKFNEINNKLKNGNKRKSNVQGITDAELAGIIANKFATDRKE